MIIEGDFYKLTPINESSTLYDLELLHEIGGKNPRKEFKIVGYGMSLMTCLQKITAFAIHKKFDTLTLKEYINEIKKTYDALRRDITECL